MAQSACAESLDKDAEWMEYFVHHGGVTFVTPNSANRAKPD
jgi:hypothetical protein